MYKFRVTPSYGGRRSSSQSVLLGVVIIVPTAAGCLSTHEAWLRVAEGVLANPGLVGGLLGLVLLVLVIHGDGSPRSENLGGETHLGLYVVELSAVELMKAMCRLRWGCARKMFGGPMTLGWLLCLFVVFF